MPGDHRENSRVALSLLTAAHLDPSSPAPELLDLIRVGLAEDPEFEPKAIIGLLNISTWLIVLLEKHAGMSSQDVLAYLGRRLSEEEPPAI